MEEKDKTPKRRRRRTRTITGAEALSVCLGALDPLSKEDAAAVLRAIGAFINPKPTITNGPIPRSLEEER